MRQKINLIEKIEHGGGGKIGGDKIGGGAGGETWIHEYKGMKDKTALLSAVSRIQSADHCLEGMSWWSIPTLNPKNDKGYGFRILVLWGTVVIGLLGLGRTL